MKRREFITLLGGAAVWPLAAPAQPAYRLGILSGRSRDEPNFVAFFDELRQVGKRISIVGSETRSSLGFPPWHLGLADGTGTDGEPDDRSRVNPEFPALGKR